MTGSTRATGSDRRSPKGVCATGSEDFPRFLTVVQMAVSRVFSYCSTNGCFPRFFLTSSTMDTEGHPKGDRK